MPTVLGNWIKQTLVRSRLNFICCKVIQAYGFSINQLLNLVFQITTFFYCMSFHSLMISKNLGGFNPQCTRSHLYFIDRSFVIRDPQLFIKLAYRLSQRSISFLNLLSTLKRFLQICGLVTTLTLWPGYLACQYGRGGLRYRDI